MTMGIFHSKSMDTSRPSQNTGRVRNEMLQLERGLSSKDTRPVACKTLMAELLMDQEVISNATYSTSTSPDYSPQNSPQVRRTSANAGHVRRWFRRQHPTDELPPQLHQPRQTRPSGKIPVKGRHPQNNGDEQDSARSVSYSADEEEEEQELQRIYDLRTWDMYIRITEARKRYATMNQKSHNIAQTSTALAAVQHDYSSYGHFPVAESSQPDRSIEHEMIFGDLE